LKAEDLKYRNVNQHAVVLEMRTLEILDGTPSRDIRLKGIMEAK